MIYPSILGYFMCSQFPSISSDCEAFLYGRVGNSTTSGAWGSNQFLLISFRFVRYLDWEWFKMIHPQTNRWFELNEQAKYDEESKDVSIVLHGSPPSYPHWPNCEPMFLNQRGTQPGALGSGAPHCRNDLVISFADWRLWGYSMLSLLGIPWMSHFLESVLRLSAWWVTVIALFSATWKGGVRLAGCGHRWRQRSPPSGND